MAYLVPRGVILVIAWGITCALIKKLSPSADPVIFGIAGASCACAGTAYFAYLRKLKRDIEELERRRYGARIEA